MVKKALSGSFAKESGWFTVVLWSVSSVIAVRSRLCGQITVVLWSGNSCTAVMVKLRQFIV